MNAVSANIAYFFLMLMLCMPRCFKRPWTVLIIKTLKNNYYLLITYIITRLKKKKKVVLV